jgi:putative membrane protein
MARAGIVGETGLAPVLSAAAVLASGVLVFATMDAGPLSIQMAQHLAVMNIAAPLIAFLLLPRRRSISFPPSAIWLAGLGQIVLLWAWHAPAMQSASASSFVLHLAMLALLGAAALGFWVFLLIAAQRGQWRAIAALLMTGKLACLLGALMIFATRDVYLLPGLAIPFCTTGPSTLEDQQLAGLLMITACPLSYLVAGVVLAAQMFTRLDRQNETARPGGAAAR